MVAKRYNDELELDLFDENFYYQISSVSMVR
ncbi:MAG: hypothetical protein RLZZ546_2019 [Bacteroidota bacterium]|jgi:hypothetical protein